ncbi:MAG: hypothetical protein WBO46_07795 [Caldilineaceae bacterium]
MKTISHHTKQFVGRVTFLLTLALLCFAPLSTANAQPRTGTATTHFVKAGANSNGTGTSWANAFPKLQDALAVAQSGDEIWVAAGVYTPENAQSSFTLVDGVAIYGGFAGNEIARSARNWKTNLTVLSGDVDGDDLNSDGNFISESVTDILGTNSDVVVASNGVSRATRLDGVIVTGGKGGNGAGMNNQNSSSPTVANVIFWGNHAGSHGGGMYNNNSSPLLRDVVFMNNQAGRGGGIANLASSSPVLVNVTFTGNRVVNQGGGMHSVNSTSTLWNVSFFGNHADGEGGGMNNDMGDASLTNVVFVGNTTATTVGGGMTNVNGGTLILTNLTFVDNRSTDSGGAMYNYNTTPAIRNTIFWNNGGSESGSQINGKPEGIRNSLIQGDSNTDGGNLDGTLESNNPRFVRQPSDGGDGWGVGNNDDYGDLRLLNSSALIGKGNNSFLPADAQDLDGDANTSEPLPVDRGGHTRVVDGTVDLGAYEYGLHYRAFLPQTRK